MIVAGIIVMPLAMTALSIIWRNARTVYHLLAALAAFAVFAVSSVKIVEIIRQGTVYMTDIHGIFVNPFFLIGGAYLGEYAIYRLSAAAWTTYMESDRA